MPRESLSSYLVFLDEDVFLQDVLSSLFWYLGILKSAFLVIGTPQTCIPKLPLWEHRCWFSLAVWEIERWWGKYSTVPHSNLQDWVYLKSKHLPELEYLQIDSIRQRNRKPELLSQHLLTHSELGPGSKNTLEWISFHTSTECCWGTKISKTQHWSQV